MRKKIPRLVVTRHFLHLFKQKAEERQAQFLAVYIPWQMELQEGDSTNPNSWATSVSTGGPSSRWRNRLAFALWICCRYFSSTRKSTHRHD